MKTVVSFSGGRSSAVMAKKIKEQNVDAIYIFANTGCEHENTLKFVNDCDVNFGLNLIWVESVVNPAKGKGITHKVVTYETASRKGEPFEDVIAKYGIPNRFAPQCTRDTKLAPIKSYLKSIGLKEYKTAIGIRYDELDRISVNKDKYNYVYPLIDNKITKFDVAEECNKFGFDLNLKGDHYGNCVWCWKKSIRKLATLARDDESIFDFPKRMEAIHGFTNERTNTKRTFFREKRSVNDIIEIAREGLFTPYVESKLTKQIDFDMEHNCGESCDIHF